MTRLGQTPSQTVGPYFTMRLGGEGQNVLVPDDTPGRIRIEGVVLDGDGAHIEDALIELWQADSSGRYRHADDTRTELPLAEGFRGFGRAMSSFENGEYWFQTVKPGAVPDPEGEPQAPHISLVIQARGMLMPSFTRIYFDDEPGANEKDMVLAMVPETRRHTLLARRVDDGGVPTYRFDIRFQGPEETVFFDF